MDFIRSLGGAVAEAVAGVATLAATEAPLRATLGQATMPAISVVPSSPKGPSMP